jgi:predicted kinase
MRMSPKILVFEGVMYGITFKFSNELNDLCKMLGYSYTAIALIAPFDVIIDRIYGRNGGKQINVESIERQYTAYLKSTKVLGQNGVNVKYYNTQEYDKHNMYRILEDVLCLN